MINIPRKYQNYLIIHPSNRITELSFAYFVSVSVATNSSPLCKRIIRFRDFVLSIQMTIPCVFRSNNETARTYSPIENRYHSSGQIGMRCGWSKAQQKKRTASFVHIPIHNHDVPGIHYPRCCAELLGYYWIETIEECSQHRTPEIIDEIHSTLSHILNIYYHLQLSYY